DPVRREVYLSNVASDTGVDPALVRKRVEAALLAPPRQAPAGRPAFGTDQETYDEPAAVEMKQTPLSERYVMALLTRFPEEMARVERRTVLQGESDRREAE